MKDPDRTSDKEQNSDIFPWIEVDTHPFHGTLGELVGIDVPRLRFYEMPEGETGHSGYFTLIEHKILENQLLIKEGVLYKEDIIAIREKIVKSDFSNMDTVYEEAIFDGGQKTIAIRYQNGLYKSVCYLRSTGRRSGKEIPQEFIELRNWLIDFASSHTKFFRAFKLQFLGNDERRLDFIEKELKRCHTLLRPERTGITLLEAPPLRDYISLKALIGIGFMVKSPEINISVYVFEDSSRHEEVADRLARDVPENRGWYSLHSTNGPLLFFAYIREDEPNFNEAKRLLSKIASAFAGDE